MFWFIVGLLAATLCPGLLGLLVTIFLWLIALIVVIVTGIVDWFFTIICRVFRLRRRHHS